MFAKGLRDLRRGSTKITLALLLGSTALPVYAAEPEERRSAKPAVPEPAAASPLPIGAAPLEASSEDIVVTAQQRRQKASDVPVSITAISGEDLRRRGVDSTLDLATYVPGLAIGQNSGEGDFPFISIRGVSMRDFADTNESPSAVYINDFYKANLVGLDSQIFDIDHVEVLRGPQGTLYGRNATGGLIKYVTRQPGNSLEGYASAEYGSYNEVKLEAGVGGPINDVIGVRISGLYHRHDGWFPNIYPGQPASDALDTKAVRGEATLKPTDRLSASIMVQYYHNDNNAGNAFAHKVVFTNAQGLAQDNPSPTAVDSFGYREPASSDPRFSNSDRSVYLRTAQVTATGNLAWTFDDFTVTSITGYETGKKDSTFDSDSGPVDIRGTQVHPRGRELTEELRIAGESGPVKWLGGLYYFDYRVHGDQARYRGPVIGYRPNVDYDLRSKSYAGFANIDFALTDKLTATGGIRYTKEKKDYFLQNREFNFIFSTATAGDLARRDDGSVNFNARLSYAADPSTLLYAGVARATKAGTFNVGYTVIPFAAIPVKPEQLTSYEAGIKKSLSDKRLSIDASGFYYDYKNSQAFQYDGTLGSATTFNRNARIFGGEVEAHARPAPGLEIGFLGSYLNATLKDVNLPAGGAIVNTRMPLAPKWTLTGLVDYRFVAPWPGELSVSGDVTYKSSQYFDAYNSPHQFEPGYTVGNAQVSWTDPSGKREISFFVRNIADKIYRTYSFDLSISKLATDVYARPRWFGGGFTYRFR